MALETAQYVNQLVASNPASSDLVATGKNHLQIIKQALLNTFPNANGPFTLGPNDALGFTPVGGIIMWFGSTVPANWHLCDGSTVTTSLGTTLALPDLRDRFIVGSGLGYTIGNTGGASALTATGAVQGHALTTDELPAHNHPLTDPGHIHAATQDPHSHGYQGSYYFINSSGSYNGASQPTTLQTDTQQPAVHISTATTGIAISNTGGNQAHTHTLAMTVQDNRPPYYALAFIARV